MKQWRRKKVILYSRYKVRIAVETSSIPKSEVYATWDDGLETLLNIGSDEVFPPYRISRANVPRR
jgi:hypothetical protein